MKKNFFTDDAARAALQEFLSSTRKKTDFQRAQCVWLRQEYNMKAVEVATITNLQPGTVRKIWSAYAREGEKALLSKNRGGRRHFHLSKEEEKLFLTPFFKKAENSGMLLVAEIQEAYQERVGRRVPKSTIYRMLSRHGWKRKPGKTAGGDAKKTKMHEYWIDGCSQILHPERTGNIAQQWLHSTLNSMVKNDGQGKGDD